MFEKKYSHILNEVGILPVICPENKTDLDTVLKAILPSRIRCMEITLRHPFAAEAIAYIKEYHSEIIVGAGTVTTEEKLNIALKCNADFCVSPGLNVDLVLQADRLNMPFVPGCSIPSEMLAAKDLGLTTLKFFPADCLGGVKALNLYKGALEGLSFIPTGGITQDNFEEYISCDNVLACGGSFMMPKQMLKSGDSSNINSIINSLINTYERVKK